MPFAIKYLVVAAMATIAVYVGSSFVPSGTFATRGAPVENAKKTVSGFHVPRETVETVAVPPSATSVADGLPSFSGDEAASGKQAAASAGPAEQTFQAVASVGEVRQPATPSQEAPTPSTARIRPSGHDVTHWGVVISDTSFYDKDGKNRDDKLPGGTLIEQCGSTKSSKGEMALSRVWRNGTWAGPYLVSTAALIRFAGGREDVPADALDALCKYYTLNGAAMRRQDDLKQRAASQNPYFAELKKKATAYNEHKKRAEALTAERDAAKGPKRSKIITELTELKNAESREAAEVKELTKKYEDWKKAHPSAAASGDFSSDRTINDCYRQMNELKPQLSMFGL